MAGWCLVAMPNIRGQNSLGLICKRCTQQLLPEEHSVRVLLAGKTQKVTGT